MKRSGVSRRDFIIKGTVAAAGLAAIDPLRAVEGTTSPAAPLPAIPAPPVREVFVARMDRARAALKEAKALGLVEVIGPNLLYLTGIPLIPRERISSLILPAEGPSTLICSVMDRQKVESAPKVVDEVIYWEEYDDPLTLLVKRLKKTDLDKGTIAMGSRVDYNDFVEINRELRKLEFISTTPIVGFLRERKSTAEVAMIGAAAAVVSHAIERALPRIKEGMREYDLDDVLRAGVHECGLDGFGVVRSGPRTADPAAVTSDRRIAKDDPIVIDYQAQVHGYHGRLIRTVVLGKASGRMKMIHSVERDAQDVAVDKCKPDVVCAAIDQIVMATAGGRGFIKEAVHRAGSGIGLESEEPPWISKGYTERLAEGNVFMISPGLYTPGDYGIRTGDVAVITATGARWLFRPAADLTEL